MHGFFVGAHGSAMTITIADIESLMESAATLMEAGSYADAIPLLMSAKAKLILVPTSASAGSSIQYAPEKIDALILDCRRQAGTALGIQRQKIEYKTVDSEAYE